MTDAEKLAQAVILMCRPPKPWTPEDHTTWKACTGTPLVTMSNLVTLAMRIIERERKHTETGTVTGKASSSSSTGKVHADDTIQRRQTEAGATNNPGLAHLDPISEQKQSVE